MSGFLENLRQPEYVHVLINHLPLTGLLAALVGLMSAALARQRVALLLAMAITGLFALSAWPVYVYGEQGFDRVYSMADSPGDAALERHKQLAERWIWLFYTTAGVGLLGAVAGLRWRKSLRATVPLLLLLAVLSLVTGAVIAEAGGQVRHPEFRRAK
jgi:CHASE2 domain-containing sensor protein